MRRDPIKSAARALEVLELFTEIRAPLRLNAIFQRLSYPQSSTTALLKSLVVLGYLNYDRASRTYFPTTRVAAIGDWINHSVYGQGRLLELMQVLQERTDETVVLVSQNDMFLQYLRVIQPGHEHKLPPAEGSMRLLTNSSGGLVLLSRMSDKAVTKLWRHMCIHEQDRAMRVDLDQLLEQLAWIRREGYCFLVGFPVAAGAAVAFPLEQREHAIPLAIGVGGLNTRIVRRKSAIVEVMQAAIAEYHADQALPAAVETGTDDSKVEGSPPPDHGQGPAPDLIVN